MISIEALSVSCGDKAILSNINLTVNKGEMLAVIGPNGGGKPPYLKV